jgi:DNA replicative helicase MCM subunit Mcm2 (Cdc46/Mcm family)
MNPSDFEELLRTQRMMASKIIEENSFDAKIKLLEIIRNMTTSKNKKIHTEAVIYEAQVEGLSEGDIIGFLDELKRDNLVIEPDEGFIKLT